MKINWKPIASFTRKSRSLTDPETRTESNTNELHLATNEEVNAPLADKPPKNNEQATEFISTPTVSAKKFTNWIINTSKKIDNHHQDIATKVEDVSMTTGVLAGIAAAGAAIAAPTGISAIGVAVGITSAPLIVTAAPVLATIATVTGTISGGTYLYAKWKSRIKKNQELKDVSTIDKTDSNCDLPTNLESKKE